MNRVKSEAICVRIVCLFNECVACQRVARVLTITRTYAHTYICTYIYMYVYVCFFAVETPYVMLSGQARRQNGIFPEKIIMTPHRITAYIHICIYLYILINMFHMFSLCVFHNYQACIQIKLMLRIRLGIQLIVEGNFKRSQ